MVRALRWHILAAAALAFAGVLAGIIACSGPEIPQPKVITPDEPGPSEDGVLFRESFDACVLDGGPSVQSDNFKDDCENPLSHISFKSTVWKTVGVSHVCDDAYMNSRGFAPWVYLFRVSERPGYLACGVNSEGKRGIIQSPMLSAIAGVSDISVSFDIRPEPAMNDNFCFKVCLSGIIRSATVGGKAFPVESVHDGIEHSLIIPRGALSEGWNTITAEVSGATNGTMLYWSSETSDKSLNHGFYIDNIEVRETAVMERAGLRVLFWNIQNGMWSDQDKGFYNFKAFIEKYDPDVCVFGEAQSIYKDRSTSMCAVADRWFPSHWAGFGSACGYPYTALGGYRLYADDYYPQVILSKYPVETLELITETDAEHQALADGMADGKSHAAEYHARCAEGYCPVAHGAGLFRVDVKGRGVNIVSLHLWPHAYSYYAKFVIKNNSYDSENSRGGNVQREAEIKYICSRTVEAAKYAGEENWLMMGDFNTRSRLDNWRYALPDDSPFLSSHDYILGHTFYKDIIAETYPGHFFATRTWANDAAGNYPPRYDFMYASPSMMARVKNAIVLNEAWTNMVWAMSNYYDSSDHRPLLVDFDL